MAKLTAAERKKMPKSEFGLPKSKGYPMNDREHQINAKGRATQAVKAGRMSVATAKKIDAKADRLLGESEKSEKKAMKGKKC